MKLVKLLLLIVVIALSVSGCESGGQEQNANTQPAQTKQPDGSTVSTSETQGLKTEERKFETGEIEKVVRVTNPTGTRRLLVYYRNDPAPKEVRDQNLIERAMEASADEIKESLAKSLGATQEAGKEAGEKAGDVGRQAGERAKQGAEKVKDVASDAAVATGKAARKAGREIKKVGEKIKP